MRRTLLTLATLFIIVTPGLRTPGQHAPVGRPFRIRLPNAADTNNLVINYHLRGPFGGYGSFVRTKPGVWEYEIETSYDSKAARSLKAIIYCPGYEVEILDHPSLAALKKYSADFQLKPLATVPLFGRLKLPSNVKADEVRVDVRFLAMWQCEFFGQQDCLLSGYKVASVEVAPGGQFSVALPDFMNDSVVSSFKHPGHFILSTSERQSGKHLFGLRPEGSSGAFAGLPVATSYQGERVFVPEIVGAR